MTKSVNLPAGDDHATAVPYADELLPAADIDPSRWTSWSYSDDGVTYYYAKGPCPACHADAQGKTSDGGAPVESLGPQADDVDGESLRESEVVNAEIPVWCHCGYDHGHSGATGCGRSWSIRVGKSGR